MATRTALAFAAALLIAAALRLPRLAERPMHADEAVHAEKLARLADGAGYAYDPSEYHGPTLYYLTLLAARLRGQMRGIDIDEVTLRIVPALFGLALVASPLALRRGLGPAGAGAAALLTAVSPAMVFYSRYAIHETLLVFWSVATLAALWRYLARPALGWALAAGAGAGLMLATKETAGLALAAMAVALPASGAGGTRTRAAASHALAAGGVLLATAATLFSSFFTNAAGLADALRTYGFYADRATTASPHVHAWDYYLRLLIHFPASGTPVWSEGLVLGLACVGTAAGWRRALDSGAEPRLLRFLSVYTLFMIAAYAAIPYKTPWCLLGFLHGAILLAGAGAAALLRAGRLRAARAVAALLLACGGAHLGWQAFAASFRFASDPRNPYVYAHTTRDVFAMVARIEALARAHPEGRALTIHVVSRANLWPLPFYLRRFTNVGWWNGVSDSASRAPLILATPDMEPALVEALYEVPPPGERELYVGAFDRPLALRPAVELRGYVRNRLWEAFRAAEAEPVEGTGR